MQRVQKSENLLVEEIFGGRRKQSGEVGIEIEVEGRNLPQQAHMREFWEVKRDGSLRGESAEYVLTQPVARRNVSNALLYLDSVFTAVEAQPNMSYRTSVHVHVNQQGMNFRTLITEMVLYYIFEESLVNFCGPERVGNKFCLRARDAEDIVRRVYEAVTGNHFHLMIEENIKYAAMNINALARFNSLEFRAMRGTLDQGVINKWVEMLLCIKDAATSGKFDSPTAVVARMSEMGPEEFTRYIFGEHADVIFEDREYKDHMYYGVRLVQELAYGVRWNHTPEEQVSNGKKPKRNANLNNDANILEAIQFNARQVAEQQQREREALNRFNGGQQPPAPPPQRFWDPEGAGNWNVEPVPVEDLDEPRDPVPNFDDDEDL